MQYLALWRIIKRQKRWDWRRTITSITISLIQIVVAMMFWRYPIRAHIKIITWWRFWLVWRKIKLIVLNIRGSNQKKWYRYTHSLKSNSLSMKKHFKSVVQIRGNTTFDMYRWHLTFPHWYRIILPPQRLSWLKKSVRSQPKFKRLKVCP